MRRRVFWPLVAVLCLGACDRGGEAEQGAAGEGADARPRAVPTAEIGTLPAGVTREVAVQGRELYAESCVVCHGQNGEGTQLGSSLADAAWDQAQGGTLEAIEQVVREGVAEPEDYPVPMHPYGELLSPQQIRAVSAYTYSLRGQ